MSVPAVTERSVPDGDGPGATTGQHPVMKLIARTPVFVALDATLREAARLLTEESIGALLVYSPHGPAGVLSERDIVAALAEGADPGRDLVRDYMTPDIESVPATATIAEAEQHMLANEIRHLVVTQDGKTLGLISMRDVLAAMPAG